VAKNLLLLRHAKAVPAEAGMADRDRPLAERGRRDAAAMGAEIARGGLPDLILCSPSLRTRQTLDAVSPAFPHAVEFKAPEALYGGDVSAYLEAIAAYGGVATRLLVIGHNPTVHALALMLARSPEARLAARFPTAALAELKFSTGDWARLRPGDGALIGFVRPKDLGHRNAGD
jgi:phosphohistidine phosphatase